MSNPNHQDNDNERIEDCPICMESISKCTNHTMTECGHSFHTTCIMKNVSKNGFQCPYCRTCMFAQNNIQSHQQVYTEFPSSENYYYRDTLTDNVDTFVSTTTTSTISEIISEELRRDFEAFLYHEDIVLRGMRIMFQRASGEPHELSDVRAERDYAFDNFYNVENLLDANRVLQRNKPPISYIVDKLTTEYGIAMSDMVEAMLQNRVEYNVSEDDHFGRINDNIQEKINNIIESYNSLVDSVPMFTTPVISGRL